MYAQGWSGGPGTQGVSVVPRGQHITAKTYRTNNAEVKRMTKGAVRVYGYARQTKGSKGATSAVGSNRVELRDTSGGSYLTGRYPG